MSTLDRKRGGRLESYHITRVIGRVRLAGEWWNGEPERELARAFTREGAIVLVEREAGDDQWQVTDRHRPTARAG
jgi:hypothetical protein